MASMFLNSSVSRLVLAYADVSLRNLIFSTERVGFRIILKNKRVIWGYCKYVYDFVALMILMGEKAAKTTKYVSLILRLCS
jgi:hypothetical protein